MRRTVAGILAHVDAGKTTLSEAMLYCAGAIRTLGRVDHGDALLDNFALERARGITIFSKQAVIILPSMQLTLLDTPGHVDFSPEMERTLDVLDCAVLVISAPAGVQSHTRTVWKLLRARGIPTFLFVNKMDLPGADRAGTLAVLRAALGDGVVDMEDLDEEAAALCSDVLLEEYLRSGALRPESLTKAIAQGRLFPCWFGAALRLTGVETFLQGLERFAPACRAGGETGARVFKISRDEQGTRLTHLKVTGGVLRVRDTLSGEGWTEKVTALRVYAGAKYRSVDQALPGDVVAAVGLSHTLPGMGLGTDGQGCAPLMEPVLRYRLILPSGCDHLTVLRQLRLLAEEEPQLQPAWDPQTASLQVSLMGPVQQEILRALLLHRFALSVDFGPVSILYRETIAAPVEGMGHYEPLRHYAEVHLALEPGERGSGLRFATACKEDDLARNWQRLVLTHLAEKQHLGVLTGSPITDMTITLLSGRAHLKHTEGGDFRQAAYRALRQGLMTAQSVLLEPWFDFRLELPKENLGRAMSDLQRMGAEFQPPETLEDAALLLGRAPVSAFQDYPQELAAYTHGLGRCACTPGGYAPCAAQDALVAALGYHPEADLENTADSVFCSHGAGYTVHWREAPAHMHLPPALAAEPAEAESMEEAAARYCRMVATDQELTRIFERTYGPIRRASAGTLRPTPRPAPSSKPYQGSKPLPGPEYVLVDGYNIIFAWDELRRLADNSLDLARERLIHILRNYQGVRLCQVILVFDAYKVRGNPGSVQHLGGVTVIYTKEAETADMYIERASSTLAKQHRVRVATSDALEQIIIMGHGCLRVSAAAFQAEVQQVEQAIRAYLTERP